MTRAKKDEENEVTEIEGGDTPIDVIPEEKPKPKRQSGKKVSMSSSEIANILDLLIGGIAKLFSCKYKYRATDYDKEAVGLERLAAKFPIILKLLLLADPLIIVFGLAEKFREIFATRPKKQKNDTQPESGSAGAMHLVPGEQK